MSWVDLVIIVVAILGALHGRAVGAVRQVAAYVGLAAGFYVGTRIAPAVSSHVAQASWRPGAALATILVAALLGDLVFSILASFVAKALRVVMLGLLDAVAGAVIGVLGALVGCWLVAGLLASTTWTPVASAVQSSRILRAMDQVMPPLPAIEARVQALLRNDNFPNIFANVIAPSLSPPVSPNRLGPLVANQRAPSDVVKVLADGGCATGSEGTGFYVGPHEVVTNAHVVAGHTLVTVGGALAHVALYDARNDLAVLRVVSPSEPALALTTRTPHTGAAVRVIGFPLNQTRTLAPGYFEGTLNVTGRDIYDQDLATRPILSLEVNINPGNSGSPVLFHGAVIGIVESKSTSYAATAYAIPSSVIAQDLARTNLSATASTESCLP